MYADPLAERLWSRLGGTHTSRSGTFGARPRENPLVTPLVLRVLGKKRKKCCILGMELADVECIFRRHTHALLMV